MVSRWEIAIPHIALDIDVDDDDAVRQAFFKCLEPRFVMQWVALNCIEEFFDDNEEQIQIFKKRIQEHRRDSMLEEL